jgi:nucleotide-binding universal stress UspA family protein
MTNSGTEKTSTGKPSVVVGVDGSESSKHALAWAAYLARGAGADLDVISTWSYPSSFGWSAAPVDWNPQQDLEKSLTEVVDEVFGQQRPAGLRLHVLEGNAAAVLLEQSSQALMLVVGSRGHGGFTGLLIGSVSATLAERAECPVLVVHGDSLPPA